MAPDGRQESRQESLKVYQLTTENVQTFVQVRAWRERPGGEHPQRGQACIVPHAIAKQPSSVLPAMRVVDRRPFPPGLREIADLTFFL